jgi:deoxyribose-phosphate aldolase
MADKSIESIIDGVLHEFSSQMKGDRIYPSGQPTPPESFALASMIDHTILRPEATAYDIERLCGETIRFHFASVCINPSYVPLAVQFLRGNAVPVCTVIGFPLGTTSTAAKAAEAEQALEDGASELDMVLHVGKLKERDYRYVEQDMKAIVECAARHRALVKVILETCLLSEEEKIIACAIVKYSGANFVKTSTGFGKSGATAGDVALMRRVVGPDMGVKASGGIRNRADALAMVHAGANRIGTSAGVIIVSEKEVDQKH